MNKKTLYFECFSGISGDMTVSALLDLGVDQDYLLEALKTLPLEGYEIQISRVKKLGIDACQFKVILEHHHSTEKKSKKHPHDTPHHPFPPFPTNSDEQHSLERMPPPQHFYHEEKNLSNSLSTEKTHDFHQHDHLTHENHDHHDHKHHHHDHEHHHHDHEHHHHDHEHHHHNHEHRNLEDVLKIIQESQITDGAKERASKMFQILAKSEGKAHGLPINEVHFHEVGAVDSIVDFVAAAICLDYLNVTELHFSTIYEGQGFVKCQHGLMPVPVPAVVNIAQEYMIPLRITDNLGEMVTPTGIAILASEKAQNKLPHTYTILNTGIGSGTKDFPHANILRVMEIEDTSNTASSKEDILQLETNLDDCTPESLGYTMELLFDKGAKDVFFTPIYMKKSRPATKLTVLCAISAQSLMEDIIFTNLSTIGIRATILSRTTLNRQTEIFTTSLGEIQGKIVSSPTGTTIYPEYEHVKAICLSKNLPFTSTYEQIKWELNQKTNNKK